MASQRPPVRDLASGRSMSSGRPAGSPPVPHSVYVRRRIVVGSSVLAFVIAGAVVFTRIGGGGGEPVAEAADVAAAAAESDEAAAVDPTDGAELQPEATVPAVEVDGATADSAEEAACMLAVPEVKRGDSGDDVVCAQRALRAAGFYDGDLTGEFDDSTDSAARDFQTTESLYVDGIVGKNTASELGIWPGSESFIVRTPAPAPGATDLWGMLLSSVASAGDDAPPLPDDAGQGNGKRVVYERASQRVWAIDDQERIVRSYLVSGSQYRNEVPGVHTVYSKSESALGWDLQADLPFMIRYTQTERGHIGFHAIPSWRDSGEKLQTEDELGQKLSGGCTRQAPLDAQFLWEFANVGTKVYVL